jgi:hypothetical protein
MFDSTRSRSPWDILVALATVAVGASGLVFVVFGLATQSLFKTLIYGTAPNPVTGTEALRYTRFVYGVLGAVMFGWALALWFIVTGPLRQRQRWAWNAVAFSMLGWFLVDSSLSLLSGYGENAILNLAFGVMFAVPLYFMRRELSDTRAE